MDFGFGTPVGTPTAPSSGGGFATPVSAPATPVSFGAPTAVPTSFGGAPVSFGGSAVPASFGGQAVAPAVPTSFGGAPAVDLSTLVAAPRARVPELNDVAIALFADIEEIKKRWKGGMKITITNGPGPIKKIVMEDDTKSVDDAVEQILDKHWRKTNAESVAIMTWLEGFPGKQPLPLKLQETLNTGINRYIAKLGEVDPEYPRLVEKFGGAVMGVLQPAVEQRRVARESQLNLLDEIQSLIKANQYLPRASWKLIKFCPRNDGALKFRVDGMVPGLGNTDECVPAKYEFVNPFLKK